jgi:CRISPR type III-B/RAMP module RAMP protein Cmr6
MNSQYGSPCLPKQIADLVDSHVSKCQNLSLILDKYVPWNVIDNTNNKESKKGSWLRDVIQEKPIDSDLAQAAYYRWSLMLESLKVKPFTAPLDWRMVVGLGGESVLETDITLHHLYGIPFIPGSALKGLTRAYVTAENQKFFVPKDAPEGQRKPSLKDETDHPDIQRIFGNQKAAGTVLFFDAMPLSGKISFTVDIMNPHYSKYYGSLKSNNIIPPANDQSPIPVPFLAVANPTIFAFALAPRDPSISEHQEDMKQVKTWLQEALHYYGVGGKTSAGYGYFQISEVSAKTDKSSGQASQAGTQIADQLRQNLPQFREGQELQNCQVIVPTERMQKLFPTASAYLRYLEFPAGALFIAIEPDIVEARDWKTSESRSCVISRTEEHEDCLILVCKPRQKKNKKNKEKK